MDYLELDWHRDQDRFDAFWDECRDYPEDPETGDQPYGNGEGYSDEF